MKKLKLIPIAILAFFFTSCKVLCQNYPAAGQYITNNTMGAFQGTWQWVSGVDTVQIFLTVKKVYIDINGGYYSDAIVGWHIYKKFKTVVESSYQYLNNVNQRTYLGGNSNNITQLSGPFKDITKSKSGELELSINTTVTPNQLIWKLRNFEGARVRSGGTPYDWGFTLPTDMVFIKQ